MVKKIGEGKIRELVKIQKNFDLGLVDFEHGFESKIYPLISSEMIENLKDNHADIYDLIIKAGVYYSFVLDIPKIKVHISNYGISQHEQGKARNAPWWDVRDLGLSWVKKADECLAKGLKRIAESETGDARNKISFFKQGFPLVDMETMNSFYSIGNSPHLYLKLCKLMRDSFDDLMYEFRVCTAEFLLSDPRLAGLIRNYLLHKSVLYAMESPGMAFVSGGIVLVYEELPWQRSAILSERVYMDLRYNFEKKADEYLKRIFDYMNEHRADFPCYTPPETAPKTKIIRGKGGVFL